MSCYRKIRKSAGQHSRNIFAEGEDNDVIMAVDEKQSTFFSGEKNIGERVLSTALLGDVNLMKGFLPYVDFSTFFSKRENENLLIPLLSDAPVEVVAFLLDHGLPVNNPDFLGITLLHTACSSGRLGLAELLIERGANADVRDFLGRTPLFSAVGAGDIEMFDLLTDAGASLCATDINGKTLWNEAVKNFDEGIAERLANAGVEMDEETLSLLDGKIESFIKLSPEVIEKVKELTQ